MFNSNCFCFAFVSKARRSSFHSMYDNQMLVLGILILGVSKWCLAIYEVYCIWELLYFSVVCPTVVSILNHSSSSLVFHIHLLELSFCMYSLIFNTVVSCWRDRMKTFSVLLVLCEGNSPVTGEFPSQRPATRSSDLFFDLRLNNGWVNSREAGDWRCHRAHYDVTVIIMVGILLPFNLSSTAA